jgi:hypothetical protein
MATLQRDSERTLSSVLMMHQLGLACERSARVRTRFTDHSREGIAPPLHDRDALGTSWTRLGSAAIVRFRQLGGQNVIVPTPKPMPFSRAMDAS